MKIRPPKRAVSFLRWFCREDYIEEIEGDLTEVFEKEFHRSPGKARRSFTWSVIKYFRPGFMKSFKSIHQINRTDMLRHNFLISLRNFKRNKSSFLINVVGLSTGLACALLIYLWVMDEKNINHFNEKDSQLYQVLSNSSDASGTHTGTGTQGPLATALAREIPEVEHAVTVVPASWFGNKGAISVGDIHLKAKPQFVSKDYFNVFTCKIIQGDASNPLPDINSVLISADLAKKIFPAPGDAIGKTFQWSHYEHSGEYHITGIFENMPSNATASFDILFNFDEFVNKRQGMLTWDNSDPETYVVLKEGTDIAAFNRKIAGFVKAKDPKVESSLFVQKFSDRYLYGNYENGTPTGGRILYVQLLSIIGSFILIIACINFMNLTTARATRRIKEVGVKKSVGASRSSLVGQYLSESAIVTFISLLVALGLVFLMLPQFNIITGKTLFLKMNSSLAVIIGSVFLITSVLAGSYPALYLSGFKPAAVIKGKLETSFGELLVRKGLVIFQFTISVILIACVWIVNQQMEFVQNKNLGYKKDNIIVVEMEGTPVEKLQTFHTELKKIPGVISAGSFYHNLSGTHGAIELEWEGKTPDQHADFANLEVGYDFIETMNIEFHEGHSFTQSEKSKNEIILNEAAIRFMGLKDPIGKTVKFWGSERQIVGITKDFNFESLHEEVKPVFFPGLSCDV
ncbi:MAG: ABC transporter permease [Bacteroidota bacterium]